MIQLDLGIGKPFGKSFDISSGSPFYRISDRLFDK